MFYYLKILLVFAVVILTGWFFVRDYLPDSIVKSTPGQMLSDIVDTVSKDLSKITKGLERGDYMGKIKTVSGKEFNNVIQNGIKRNAVMLIYIYSLDSSAARINFDDVVEVNNNYDKKLVTILALALEEDKEKLAKFLNSYGNVINFVPLQLNPDDKFLLSTYIGKTLSGYSRPPYMAITNKDGIAIVVPTGLVSGNKIKRTVDNVVKGLPLR